MKNIYIENNSEVIRGKRFIHDLINIDNRKAILSPIQELALGIILQAITDYGVIKNFKELEKYSCGRNPKSKPRKSGKTTLKNKKNAIAFIESNNENYIYSFNNCCLILDVEPQMLKKKILNSA